MAQNRTDTSSMKVERIPLAELREDPANVRKHGTRNLASIKASLIRYGQQKPIVIDAKNVVRAGNGTLAAARELGWPALDCVRTKLPPRDAQAYAIADNRTAELAEWGDNLADVLDGFRDEEYDLDALGFTDAEIDGLLGGDGGEGDTELKPVETDPPPPKMAWVLIGIPTVRFLSIEPLLEDLGPIDLTGIHWVIVGGESGPGWRPMEHAWALSIRDQCRAANVPFFFKQSAAPRTEMGIELDGRIERAYPEVSAPPTLLFA